MKTPRFRLAALLVPLLLAPGCGQDLARFRTVPLTGATAGLGKLEGRWFDEDGNLTVEISGGGNPRLGVRLSSWLQLTDARVEDGEVSFHVKNDYSAEPAPSSMDGVWEKGIVIYPDDRSAATRGGCMPWTALYLSRLARDPSPLWVMKRSAKRVAQGAGQVCGHARDEVFDHIARIL